MCIVTGPRIDLAITLIERLKKLFADKGLVSTFTNKETVMELNGVRIEAFPSHHLDSMRGLPNVSFILLDEADFFPPGQQQDARDVSERYIGKSNPYIVMVSTPNTTATPTKKFFVDI
jgi:late competence protein required for DNA uptake (superfamily II DNA/RNA helicase)